MYKEKKEDDDNDGDIVDGVAKKSAEIQRSKQQCLMFVYHFLIEQTFFSILKRVWFVVIAVILLLLRSFEHVVFLSCLLHHVLF